ncbi:hypothetical protein [Nocardia puris]|uniref:Uncharacterized protein n=1 Tax=Nocardia puris TaxID=208602 RepID=A0A366DLX8_9NOCA|nr:hypothetical protein [Nocardia puris]RBO90304.1 hypothetical protein DFR74_106189 [Nocardia puris]
MTQHGQDRVEAIRLVEHRLGGGTVEFKDFLRSGPCVDELDLTRSRETPRDLDWAPGDLGNRPDPLRDQGDTRDLHGRADAQGACVDEAVVRGDQRTDEDGAQHDQPEVHRRPSTPSAVALLPREHECVADSIGRCCSQWRNRAGLTPTFHP